MTPREFARHMDAESARAEASYKRDLVVAWHTAAFALAGLANKLPDLRTVLNRVDSGAQNFEQMKAQLQALSELNGAPLRQVNRG